MKTAIDISTNAYQKSMDFLQEKKKRIKKQHVRIGLVFLLLSGTILTIVSYLIYQSYDVRYHHDLSLAQTGLQHMQKAETLLVAWSHSPLDTALTKQAGTEFSSASKPLSQLNSDLQSLPKSLIGQIPSYGAKLDTATRLVPLALTLAQMGASGCRILNTLMTGLQHPLSTQSQGLTASDLASAAQDAKGLKSLLALATQQINQLQPSDMKFDGRIPQLVSAFSKEAPLLGEWIDLLPVAPTLLGIGTPANYLIEVLDSTELRPGGGFIGNYGIATVAGGRLAGTQITDVDLLDRPFVGAGLKIPYPAAYSWFDLAPDSWSLRDANLDADFPTAARYSEQIYQREGGTTPVQGVIAITPGLIQQVLAVTGPIAVPEYQETITADNFIDRIHYHQLSGIDGSDLVPSPDGHSSMRKRFTEILSEHLMAAVRQFPSTSLSKFAQILVNSLRSKDIQLYLNSNMAENLLQHMHLDSAIQSSVYDGLLVVDANVGANKANNFMTDTLADQITIDRQGNAIHHATISYAWTTPGPVYGSDSNANNTYRDYLRVYLPPGSLLQSQDGWGAHDAGKSFGREEWAGLFTLSSGQTRNITLTWTVPHAATRDAQGWHYQETIQRQAGASWTIQLNTQLPSSAVLKNTRGGLQTKGKQTAILNQPLYEDLNLGIDYA